ncbi:MAG: hypothetical protein QOH35_1463, partial [Acidobacteriaceae bacterium]|nr:hypothetical protein [Acidobacteriaceae bacterium]
ALEPKALSGSQDVAGGPAIMPFEFLKLCWKLPKSDLSPAIYKAARAFLRLVSSCSFSRDVTR